MLAAARASNPNPGELVEAPTPPRTRWVPFWLFAGMRRESYKILRYVWYFESMRQWAWQCFSGQYEHVKCISYPGDLFRAERTRSLWDLIANPGSAEYNEMVAGSLGTTDDVANLTQSGDGDDDDDGAGMQRELLDTLSGATAKIDLMAMLMRPAAQKRMVATPATASTAALTRRLTRQASASSSSASSSSASSSSNNVAALAHKSVLHTGSTTPPRLDLSADDDDDSYVSDQMGGIDEDENEELLIDAEFDQHVVAVTESAKTFDFMPSFDEDTVIDF
jgi:hypothetical protein